MFKSLNSLWRTNLRKLTTQHRKQQRILTKKLLAPTAQKKIAPKPALRLHLNQVGQWSKFIFVANAQDVTAGIAQAARMQYWLYQPATAKGDALPLVVMLHGCEQTATEFAHGTRMNQLAERKGFGVLYPQQSARGHSHRCWPWYHKAVQSGGGEAQVIAAIIERVVAQHGFDSHRVYVAGMSAGAATAHIVALRFPHLIAAVGLHSGPVFGAAASAVGAYAVMQRGSLKIAGRAMQEIVAHAGTFPSMPAILIHGQQDTVVRPVNLHQLEQQFCQINHLTAAQRLPHSYHAGGKSTRGSHPFDTVDYRVGQKTMLRICEVFQLQHAWSGGDPAYRFNERKGPDASRMLWQFFSPHRRSTANA